MGTGVMAPATGVATRGPDGVTPDVGLVVQAANLLADLTDQEFDAAVNRMSLVITRQRRIMENVLQEGVHYGNPKDARGNKAFKKDILFQSAADQLTELFRLQWSLGHQPDVEIVTPEFVRVTVHRCLIDMQNRVIATAEGTCTSHEKRFNAYGGGFTWGKDARSELHVIRLQALKRCRVSAVAEGFGLRAWIGTDEEPRDPNETDTDSGDNKPVIPWTIEEKRAVLDAGAAKGMTRGEAEKLKIATLGSDRPIGSGKDVELMLAAIAAWVRPSPDPEARS